MVFAQTFNVSRVHASSLEEALVKFSKTFQARNAVVGVPKFIKAFDDGSGLYEIPWRKA